MGVELNPVIVPASTVVQLHAISIKKEQGVETEAAKFYRDLHHCLGQIASGTTLEESNVTTSLLTTAPTNAPAPRARGLRAIFDVPEDVEEKTKSPNVTTLPVTLSPLSLIHI